MKSEKAVIAPIAAPPYLRQLQADGIAEKPALDA